MLGEPVFTEEEHRQWLAEITGVREGSWDPSKHPKGAFPQNRGWWSPTLGSGTTQKLPTGTEQIPANPDRIDRTTDLVRVAQQVVTKEVNPSEPSSSNKSRATFQVDSKTKAKTWSGRYGVATVPLSTVGFKIITTGMRVTAAQEQAIADAVVEAVGKFSEVYDRKGNGVRERKRGQN